MSSFGAKTSYFIRLTAIISSLVLLLCSFACAKDDFKEEDIIQKELYEKAVIETVSVQKGDIKPQVTFSLTQTPYEQYNYETNIKDPELDTLYVSTGDYVEAGSVLVSFKSEKISKDYNDTKKKLEQDELLLSHTQKIKGIVEATDRSKLNSDEIKRLDKKIKEYEDTILLIEEDVRLKKAELSEKQTELDKCYIKAKDSGTITYVNKMLQNGQVPANIDIITQSCGEMLFFTEVNDEYTFKLDEEFLGKSATMEMNLKVSEINKDEESGVTTVYFKPVNTDITYIENERFTITIEKESINDVLYIDEACVLTAQNGRYYVVLVKDGMYKEARYIEVEGFVDKKAVIKSGLEYGEEVALR